MMKLKIPNEVAGVLVVLVGLLACLMTAEATVPTAPMAGQQIFRFNPTSPDTLIVPHSTSSIVGIDQTIRGPTFEVSTSFADSFTRYTGSTAERASPTQIDSIDILGINANMATMVKCSEQTQNYPNPFNMMSAHIPMIVEKPLRVQTSLYQVPAPLL